MYKLFMEFEKPEGRIGDADWSVQGFAAADGLGFVLYHTGVCAVYDLVTRNPKPLCVFKLGSYNDGTPDGRYTNHANDAMFGGRLGKNELPLLYVTAGNSGEADENGYIAYCAVEQIRRNGDSFTAETVQRIYYKNEGIENTRFQSPCWGCPASLVDAEGGYYYTFSAKYRTIKQFSRPDNAYIVTKFALPSPEISKVTLYPSDIIDQFELPFNVFFTQGGTLKDEKIWYLFGCASKDYPDALNVIDLKNKCYAACEDLSASVLAKEEVECCAFHDGRLLINTQGCKLYERVE